MIFDGFDLLPRNDGVMTARYIFQEFFKCLNSILSELRMRYANNEASDNSVGSVIR